VSDNQGDAGRRLRATPGGRSGAGGHSGAAGRPVPVMAPDELGMLLAAHCRHATTELPSGAPGVRWAADFLAVLPAACGRRLPDVLTTGPRMFEFLVGQEFFAAMPSPRLVPLVLGLVARVSPLLQARSARQWALWLARVWDSGSPILATIRKRTPAHLIGLQTPAPAGLPLRSAQIRDERDRLVADLASTAVENGRLRTVLTEVSEERDSLAAELAAVVGRERRSVAAAAAERDRVAGELAVITEQLRQASRDAATDAAQLQQSQARSDSLTAELAGSRAERERMSRALAVAEETAQQRLSEHELMARLLADEKLTSEQLRGELAVLRCDLEAARGTIEPAPRVIKPIDVLRATVTGFQTARMRRAAVAAGLHPDHDLLAKAETDRRQAAAVVDALRVENAELRAERDTLRARCDDPGAGPAQADALVDVEHRLTQVQAELAEARRDVKRLSGLLDRKRELVRSLQRGKDAQEIELAAANAEVSSRKAGASGLLVVAIAREQAMQEVREAQARRPPVDVED
jgi:hypothetical protein